MSAPPRPPLTAAQFFDLLYPNADELTGHLNLYTLPDKRSEWFAPTELDRAAERAVQLSRTKDVYYGFGLVDRDAREREERAARIRRGERDPKVDLAYIRGSNTTIAAIPGFCHDADLLDPAAHKKTDLPTTAEEVLALYEETYPGKPPTIAVLSGHGIHAYWLLKEAHALETPQERDDVADLLYRFQATINARGKRHGWALDGTADPAHVFRPPQTFNRKTGRPIEVTVLLFTGRRYDLAAFDDQLVDVAAMAKGKADPVALSDQLEAVEDLSALHLPTWLINQIIDGNEELTDDEGRPRDHYPSRNEAVWRIENELAERGHPDDVIAAILLDPRYGISSKPLEQRDPRQWVAADLGRMRQWQAKKSKGPAPIVGSDGAATGPSDEPATLEDALALIAQLRRALIDRDDQIDTLRTCNATLSTKLTAANAEIERLNRERYAACRLRRSKMKSSQVDSFLGIVNLATSRAEYFDTDTPIITGEQLAEEFGVCEQTARTNAEAVCDLPGSPIKRVTDYRTDGKRGKITTYELAVRDPVELMERMVVIAEALDKPKPNRSEPPRCEKHPKAGTVTFQQVCCKQCGEVLASDFPQDHPLYVKVSSIEHTPDGVDAPVLSDTKVSRIADSGAPATDELAACRAQAAQAIPMGRQADKWKQIRPAEPDQEQPASVGRIQFTRDRDQAEQPPPRCVRTSCQEPAANGFVCAGHLRGEPFTPSAEWQPVPDGYPCPPGGEFRMDFATGTNWARWPSPVAGAEE